MQGKAGGMREFEQSLPMLLLRAREAVMSRFRPLLAMHGLTEQQWRILRVLREQNGLEARQLASRTLLLQPSATGIVDRMERDGLVERRRDPDDRRKVTIWLTRKARRLYDRVAPLNEREYARMQARFETGEWERLYQALRHLIAVNERRETD
jgi:homoprotocatechuate degradation regulator HpaR